SRTASVTETRDSGLPAYRSKNRFDMAGFLGHKMQPFHFGKIGNVDGIAGLRQCFGNSDEVETILTRWVYAMNDQHGGIGFRIPVNIHRNARVSNRSMHDRSRPRIQSRRMT